HQTISIENFLSQYVNENNLSDQKIIILSTNNPEKLTKEINKYKNIKCHCEEQSDEAISIYIDHLKIINIETILKNST
ncbi:hypothetical protein KJ987_10065, partial [bacterium]|nr:hypothetical protein [bacterium]